jgi:glycosyltransferase involved in cell wall biosynthesis
MNPRTPKDPGTPSGRLAVAVDLTTFAGGGESGGLKPFVFRLLQWMAKEREAEFAFTYFTRPGLVREVEAFRRDEDRQVCIGPAPDPSRREGSRAGLSWAPDAGAAREGAPQADLLYTPWGFSEFHRAGVPAVNLVADTLHRDWPGLLPPDEVRRREDWFQRMLPAATAIQCNSEFVARKLRVHFGVPAQKLFVVLNAIQGDVVDAAARSPARPASQPYFFYPANDWPHKNHERLLRAYADYRSRAGAGAWDLVLSGHLGRPEAWLPGIEKLGIAGSCRALGHLDRDAFADTFRNAGALVFPSLYEGFGIPVLEAMALGVPVACGNLASLPEVGGKAALYFDPRRTADIAGAMLRIGADPRLRAGLAAAGLARAGEFSLAREAGLLAGKFAELALRR